VGESGRNVQNSVARRFDVGRRQDVVMDINTMRRLSRLNRRRLRPRTGRYE
jgi:hypothetical protein